MKRTKWSARSIGETAHVYGDWHGYSASLCANVVRKIESIRFIPESELKIHKLCRTCERMLGGK